MTKKLSPSVPEYSAPPILTNSPAQEEFWGVGRPLASGRVLRMASLDELDGDIMEDEW